MFKQFTMLLFFWLSAVSSVHAIAPWQEIDLLGVGLVNEIGELVNKEGQTLTDKGGNPLVPNCALTDLNIGTGFKFFYQPGSSKELVIYHSGGGACWENNTCSSPLIPGMIPTYFPTIIVDANSLNFAKGIFDTSEATNNPYKNASKIYIPYCSGDVGWGNKDIEYEVPAIPGMTFTLHHRGYANIRAVIEWMERSFSENALPKRVMVSGSSAGGYAGIGTLLPEVTKVMDPDKTMISFIGDSSNGIVNDQFLAAAPGAWGTDNTLPDHIQSAVSGGAIGLGSKLYLNSSQRYPNIRFGQYQNAFDTIQARFLNIMNHVDQPELWNDPAEIEAVVAEWNLRMTLNTKLTALKSRQYRFYTAAGFQHVVLEYLSEAGFGWCSDNFQYENSASSILQYQLAVADWADDMFRSTKLFKSDWRNASCGLDCQGGGPTECP